jgi:hypothetical protein
VTESGTIEETTHFKIGYSLASHSPPKTGLLPNATAGAVTVQQGTLKSYNMHSRTIITTDSPVGKQMND